MGECASCDFKIKIINRSACAIEFSDTLILTGGEETQSKVSVYSMENDNPGYVADLPELQVGREDHGCGYYIDGDSKRVKHKNCL